MNKGHSKLLDHKNLEASDIVANNTMNRERELTGGNGYAREIGIHPTEFLKARLQQENFVTWLDLCCGTGRALIQTAEVFQEQKITNRVKIIGVDLVNMFYSPSQELEHLELIAASIHTWESTHKFDLITCIHGIHYLGDKLSVLQKACSWLKPNGLFLANFDLNNFRLESGKKINRSFHHFCKEQEIQYNTRKKLFRCQGQKHFEWPFQYIGADDKSGSNYTGQPAVTSVYKQV